jgi:hypothetical protein
MAFTPTYQFKDLSSLAQLYALTEWRQNVLLSSNTFSAEYLITSNLVTLRWKAMAQGVALGGESSFRNFAVLSAEGSEFFKYTIGALMRTALDAMVQAKRLAGSKYG